MKKFITDIKTVAALLMAGAAFTACSSDSEDIATVQPVNPTQQTYTLTVEAAKGNDATTRALSLSGSTLNATWGASDEVKVYNSSSQLIGTLTPETTGEASSKLTGTITATLLPSVNDELTLKFLTPDSYTSQDGTLDYIAANCDYATATVTVSAVNTTTNTITTSVAEFDNQQAIVKFTILDKDYSNIAYQTNTLWVYVNGTLVSKAGNESSTSNVVYIAVPGVSNGTIKIVARKKGASKRQYIKENVTLINGQYYDISAKTTAPHTPENVVDSDKGKFVGADNYIWDSATEATQISGAARAVVSYVGSCTNYFTKCLCLALEDLSTNRIGNTEAHTLLETWASTHSILGYNTDNGGVYDGVNSTWKNATELKRGWRLPTVCDLRYLLYSYNGMSLTEPATVVHGTEFGTEGTTYAAFRTAVNAACGNENLQNLTWGGYGTSSRMLGSESTASTWWWGYPAKFMHAPDNGSYKYFYRPVFAY